MRDEHRGLIVSFTFYRSSYLFVSIWNEMVNNQLCYLLLCCFVCDANNKDVVLLAFWILFLVPNKTLSPRGNAILHPSNNNIISIPLVIIIIIIIIVLWQSYYLYQLDICIVLVSLLRLMQRLLFMRFLDIRILCWFVDCCSCVFWIFVFCVVRLLRLMQRLLI